jgi:hypothetical protein
MIMTVNCRFLKPLDFASRERRAVLRRWFSAVKLRSPKLAFIACPHRLLLSFWPYLLGICEFFVKSKMLLCFHHFQP